MGEFLYGRKYRVLVANKENTALDVSNLRCTFNIEKSVSPNANIAEVVIYNLSAGAEKELINEGCRLIVEAGYDANYGKIFDGDIVQTLREREDGVNYCLTIIALDGDAYLNLSFVKMTFNAGLTQRQIIEQLATKATIPTEIGRISPELSTQKLPRGKVVFGSPKKYLNEIARGNAARFWVDEGLVHIVKATDIAPGEALVLTPETGLIGTPQQTEHGVHITCLLNPAIRLKTMIKIDNSIIHQFKVAYGQMETPLDNDGQYQVYSLQHVGDTRGDEWFTKIIGISRYGAKTLPTMMENKQQNPN
ncbi:phage protein [Sporomusa sphaeroides]|uniref:Uncharacterized protein n=1 Tax=Sporomusa sphaeroides DSM 2875 TaxID=1337886 RepID=A0ABM9W3V3_9FIRM|nr:hypothetical protein [Sporomusa sphaeroides]OLS56817.1 hypothetical protein SPSPH_03070 [Sporomusa sphaeroides DSM 2875]CVK18764.1 hypothetical protein SSPH_01408 [Sporomusa sphaeroides DSM 2875]